MAGDAGERARDARGNLRLVPDGSLRLFNTLTRAVESVEPIDPGHARMYTCGPTVYRFIHVGNLRSFTMADWIRRALTYHGLRVTHVKNITDVGHMRQEALDRGEDKLIAQARREGKSPWEIAAFYTDAFLSDEAKLHILPAHVFPRATDHIAEMIALVERLIARGHAYVVEHNVFFDVRSFPSYGRLSGNVLDYLGQGQHTGSELDAAKRTPEDFPLWKRAEEGRVMAWESPWGRGFPGWHIECSAMSVKYLGTTFDIHTGGIDNLFPHHEDERAQSEAASGEPLVRHWVHGQHLLADGLKMAKSTGNAYTLADVEARGFEPLALRYFFTTAKYRARITFTFRALRAAQTALSRLRETAYRLYDEAGDEIVGDISLHPCRRAFLAAVDDDLNIPLAMGAVWRMLRDSTQPAAQRLKLLYDFDRVLGFDLANDVMRYAAARGRARVRGAGGVWADDAATPERVLALARERAEARAAGDYATADALRERIRAAEYDARDGRDGGTRLVPRREEEALISAPGDVPSRLDEPDRHAFSVHLLAHNSRDDLERCVASVCRHAGGRDVELVIVDNGSTDDTLAYLRRIDHAGAVDGLPARVIFADHNMGFAAGRNAGLRASTGRVVVLLDTSVELSGDIWTPIERLLADPTVGLVGPFGLVTRDLKEFAESAGPEVDAIEGYLMAFRRATLSEVGPANEKFRFYRLLDVDYSFEFKKAGYRVVASAETAARVVRHPHREWLSLSEEERGDKSKKNFDLYYKKRHHARSLLVMNERPGQAAPWGHDHDTVPVGEIDPRFEHAPVAGAHTHEHKHWPDHAHSHAHTHAPRPAWHAHGEMARYVPGEGEIIEPQRTQRVTEEEQERRGDGVP